MIPIRPRCLISGLFITQLLFTSSSSGLMSAASRCLCSFLTGRRFVTATVSQSPGICRRSAPRWWVLAEFFDLLLHDLFWLVFRIDSSGARSFFFYPPPTPCKIKKSDALKIQSLWFDLPLIMMRRNPCRPTKSCKTLGERQSVSFMSSKYFFFLAFYQCIQAIFFMSFTGLCCVCLHHFFFSSRKISSSLF